MSQKTLVYLLIGTFFAFALYLGHQMLTSGVRDLQSHEQNKEQMAKSILDPNTPSSP